MALDYSAGCVNFRDVGEFLHLIAGESILPPGKLLRGGKIDFLDSLDEIGSPKTIINLRNGLDQHSWPVKTLHFPTSNTVEKYNTSDGQVRRWLNAIVASLQDEQLRYPVLVHCTSGKDRTGIVVAALLSILGVSEQVIVTEYLLSDGEVKEEWMVGALRGIGKPEAYFNRIDLNKVKRNLLQATPAAL
ncbi:tyrosine-protein phosphatase [Deinococcus sp. Arct2-2]|uniref:tyrosine-protein phosphatase n=1 Tax=Deinococcus sp. Arct2-2 TaxID=2568653 RepID=UPI0010A446BA|nr:tyrosine-protein phosphatase [Deinococcus sp. Arct2-2]THF68217.1 tyrosine-protein phosphatase [Deinococcus sp. Arct2-2]